MGVGVGVTLVVAVGLCLVVRLGGHTCVYVCVLVCV